MTATLAPGSERGSMSRLLRLYLIGALVSWIVMVGFFYVLASQAGHHIPARLAQSRPVVWTLNALWAQALALGAIVPSKLGFAGVALGWLSFLGLMGILGYTILEVRRAPRRVWGSAARVVVWWLGVWAVLLTVGEVVTRYGGV